MADETPAPTSTESNETDEVVVKHNDKPTIAVKVHAPFKIYYEGEAYSLSAVDATGPFDILPHHHNFLCMLVPCTLTIQTPNGPQAIKISRALMQVKADRVVVFVDV
jgi:F0F1-type ATP synthase epsilon subunit